MAQEKSGRRRYFVVTIGRSGSSLLGAVLADAGADFGMLAPAQWDPRDGQMENRAIKKAAHHLRRAYDLDQGIRYLISPKIESAWRLARGRRLLARALTEGRFFKIGDLDLLVQPSFALGYEPRVILNYRQLESNLPSLLVGRKHVGPDQLAKEYVRIYRQGLVLLDTFGGCTIGFDELQEPSSTAWAAALAATTGLDSGRLLHARGQRVRPVQDTTERPVIYSEAYAIYKAMLERAGKATPPGRHATRVSEARQC